MRHPVKTIAVKTIAVMESAPRAHTQALFRDALARWQPLARIAGVLEEDHGLPERMCSAGRLRSIRDGSLYPLFEDDAAKADICHLEGAGARSAAEAVCRDIVAGCDLVMLSKFGKLEAEGQGLAIAFAAALTAGVPVLTCVSARVSPAWETFAAPRFVVVPAEPQALDAWRDEVM